MRRRHGFSLVELLVTVAIAGILLGLALPSMGWLTAESRIGAVTGDLVRSLQTARSEAIKRSRPVELCRSADPFADAPTCGSASYATGWIVYVDADGSLEREDGPDEPVLLQSGPGEVGVEYGPSANVALRVRFDGSGAHVLDSGAPSGGTFSLDVGGEERTVEIAASGRVTATRP